MVPLLDHDVLEQLMDVSVRVSESAQVVVLSGAGISTNAGIPDFRSTASGMYHPSSSRPSPAPSSSFFESSERSTTTSVPSAKELFSYSSLLNPKTRSDHLEFMADLFERCSPSEQEATSTSPTSARATTFHQLVKRIDDLGRLLRQYTQNVDGFERLAGLSFVDLDHEPDPPPSNQRPSPPTPASADDSSSDYETSKASSSLRRPRKRRRVSRSSSITRDWALHYPNLDRDKVVAMHGNLREVACTSCGWKGPWSDRIQERFRRGEKVGCPRCEDRANVRLSASRRPVPPSSLAFLRPALLLYDDPTSLHSSHLSALSSLSHHDLTRNRPDCLVVAGTSLQIPGFKSLVRDFSREVHANGGVCVLVNREPVAGRWDDVFDYDFRVDTDAFAAVVLGNLDAICPLDRVLTRTSPSENAEFGARSKSLAVVDRTPPNSRRRKRVIPADATLPTPSPTPSRHEHEPEPLETWSSPPEQHNASRAFAPGRCPRDSADPSSSEPPASSSPLGVRSRRGKRPSPRLPSNSPRVDKVETKKSDESRADQEDERDGGSMSEVGSASRGQVGESEEGDDSQQDTARTLANDILAQAFGFWLTKHRS
ncbi:hypothetical protein JCM10212_002568 [Sporobolomyces blumeae]